MTALVDRPLEEWAVSRALFPTRLIQERCARKKKKETKARRSEGGKEGRKGCFPARFSG